MSNWRTAKRLLTLLAEVNQLYPNRNKAADGTIGDVAHQKVKSEHNPDRNGVVRALDITCGPGTGVDGQKLADRIVANRDGSLWYVIVNGHIWEEGRWVKYNGSDQHYGHVHISLYDKPDVYDNTGPWLLKGEDMADYTAILNAFVGVLLRQPYPEEIKRYDGEITVTNLLKELNGSKERAQIVATFQKGASAPTADAAIKEKADKYDKIKESLK